MSMPRHARLAPAFLSLLACAGDPGTLPDPGSPGIQSVTVSPDAVTMSVGETIQLAALVQREPGAVGSPAVAWSSTEPLVATVGAASGRVTAIATGWATITASATLGASVAEGRALVTVTPGVASLAIGGMPGIMVPGSEAQLTATVLDATGRPVPGVIDIRWDTDRADIATVSPDGVVRAGSTAGPVQVRASVGGLVGSAETVVSKTALPGRLAIARWSGHQEPMTMWLGPLDGEPWVRIGAVPSYAWLVGGPEWSRDGARLLFVCTQPVALCTLSLSGELTVVPNTVGLPDTYFGAAWSLADTTILFTGKRSAESACYGYGFGDCLGVWAIGADGSGLRPIPTPGTTSLVSAVGLRYSPDGRYAGYQLVDNRYDGGPLCVWPVPLRDGAGTCTTDEAGTPSWSPDGSRLVMRVGSSLIVKVGDGSGSGTVVFRGSWPDDLVGSPTFSPDGEWIAFQRVRGGIETSTIWLVRRDGSNLLRLTGPGWFAPSWGK